MSSQFDDVLFIIPLVRSALQSLAKKHLQNRGIQFASLDTTLQRLDRLNRLYNLACLHGFDGACHRLIPAITRQTDGLAHQLQHPSFGTPGSLGVPLISTVIPTMGELHQELQQIESEFGQWELLRGDAALVVTTPHIELEGIDLGPFEMVLELNHIESLDIEQPLTLRAVDPNYAGENEDVPHPHVRDERLCAGDATTIMNAALREGRLADYFLIVCNVLSTYNPESPYVALADWHGSPCEDCGYTMHGDDRYFCGDCERDFCDSCMGCCNYCSANLCFACLITCESCDESTCDNCFSSCTHCEQRCCNACLEDSLCPDCHEEKELSNDTPPPEPETQDTPNENTLPIQTQTGGQTVTQIQQEEPVALNDIAQAQGQAINSTTDTSIPLAR